MAIINLPTITKMKKIGGLLSSLIPILYVLIIRIAGMWFATKIKYIKIPVEKDIGMMFVRGHKWWWIRFRIR